jgi:uncharacterized protein YutE (UPF0331/DUF86 family)
MTDAALVEKKLAQIESYVADLRRLARPAEISRDVREERFVEHTLQLAIQAALDIASHVVSDDRLGEPATNRDLFEILRRAGHLPDVLATTLANMAGFRNLLVHGYDTVDLAIVRDAVEHRLDDLLAFVIAMRALTQRKV